MSEQQGLWSQVAATRDAMDKEAPDGYVARVQIYLHGSPEPFQPSRVETSKDDPWVVFHLLVHPDEEPTDPGDRVFHAHESTIARVEVAYISTAVSLPIGFGVRELDKPGS
jgi:hypothetical protein